MYASINKQLIHFQIASELLLRSDRERVQRCFLISSTSAANLTQSHRLGRPGIKVPVFTKVTPVVFTN